MMIDPRIYTCDGEAYCPKCIGDDAGSEAVGVTGFPWDDLSEHDGTVCASCRACFIAGEWWPLEHAIDRRFVRWSRCSNCNARRPYSRLTTDYRDARQGTLYRNLRCRCCGKKTERFA